MFKCIKVLEYNAFNLTIWDNQTSPLLDGAICIIENYEHVNG